MKLYASQLSSHDLGQTLTFKPFPGVTVSDTLTHILHGYDDQVWVQTEHLVSRQGAMMLDHFGSRGFKLALDAPITITDNES